MHEGNEVKAYDRGLLGVTNPGFSSTTTRSSIAATTTTVVKGTYQFFRTKGRMITNDLIDRDTDRESYSLFNRHAINLFVVKL
jgi:hypothetical protein